MKYRPQFNSLVSVLCLVAATGVQAQTDAARKPTPPPKAAATQPAGAEPVEKAVLRIVCEGESAGAHISVNGIAKGPCPIDMEIPAGTARIRAVKPISADWERSYEEELTLGAGVARKVNVAVDYRRPTAEMIKRWEAAANSGDAEAMYQLGWVYKWGTTRTIDFVKAASYFRRAAAAGHPAGTKEYGEALGWGRGVARNSEEANQLELKAAELGDGDALGRIGDNFLSGFPGFPKDQHKAVVYLKKSLEAGSASSIYHLKNIEPDKNKRNALEKRRLEIHRQRADAGEMDSARDVASSYMYSDEDDADLKSAKLRAQVFAYRLKAAATGDAYSHVQLGDSYLSGEGAPINKFLAEQAYRAAIAKGLVGVKSILERMLAQ